MCTAAVVYEYVSYLIPSACTADTSHSNLVERSPKQYWCTFDTAAAAALQTAYIEIIC